MVKRIITGIVLAGIVVGVFFLRSVSVYFVDGLIALLIFLGVYELICLFKKDMTIPIIIVICVYTACVYPAFLFLGGITGVFLLSIAFFAIANIVMLFDKKATQSTIFDFLFIMFYPIILVSLAFAINNHEQGLIMMCLVAAISGLTDTMAYFTGVLIGGKKLCPSISPKKTIAGAIGGLFGGIGGGAIIWATMHTFAGFSLPLSDLWICLILGLVGSVFNQLGDLVASNIKRKFDVKDFGNLLPGHGGAIDRIDGIMFNLIAMFAFMIAFL